MLMKKIPHPIPYQGSKRNLASRIMSYADYPYKTLYEPFAGSAAVSIFAASNNLAEHFVIGDSFSELIELWKLIVNQPEVVSKQYAAIWEGQKEGDFEYFYNVRSKFNKERDPAILLYLIARCVKNAVRFNKKGEFTQSADKRRKGTKPERMKASIFSVSQLLKGRVEFYKGDFSEVIKASTQNDLVYLDPPYQGTTYGRDKRYFHQLDKEHLYSELRVLNKRRVKFLLSYDGFLGNKAYGEELPEDIDAKRILLDAGRSSQATLSGKKDVTVESLYISKYILRKQDNSNYVKNNDSNYQLELIA